MTHHAIIVIGAGPSGIGAAIRLAQAGYTDVVVLEKSDRLGGTWRDNTYPGCACDVPSALYSYSFAPNREWSRLFAGQAEIQAYLERVATEHGVPARVRFRTELISARWQAAARRWRLETSAGLYTCDVLIGASGPWHQPRMPELRGDASFPGHRFHSARWDHAFDLRGKRVAVIGTGASAIQFVPAIQPDVARLHLLCDLDENYALPEESLKMVMGLIDQLNAMRGDMRALLRAVASEPDEVRSRIHSSIRVLRG